MANETVFEKLNRISRKGYPTVASIEVTSQCNAKCEYCYMQDCSLKDLSTKELCSAIDKFSKNGIFHLHITGGEPFLRPDILEILSYSMNCGFFYCSIFSNGILLTQKHLDFLVENKDFFIELQMSIFSHIPAKNDAYFGVPGAFNTIIKNALYLKENGIKISFAMSVFDFNIDELDETRNFFKDKDLPLFLSASKIITSPRIKKHVVNSTSYSFFKKYLLSLKPTDLENHKNTLKLSINTPPSNNTELCFGRFDFVYMDSQGDLAQCLSFRKMKLGNIFDDKSLQAILQASPNYHAVCSCKKTDLKKCVMCNFFNFCSACLGVIHSETNSLDTIDSQMCNYTHALYDLMNGS